MAEDHGGPRDIQNVMRRAGRGVRKVHQDALALRFRHEEAAERGKPVMDGWTVRAVGQGAGLVVGDRRRRAGRAGRVRGSSCTN